MGRTYIQQISVSLAIHKRQPSGVNVPHPIMQSFFIFHFSFGRYRDYSHLELVPPTCTSAVIEGLETGKLYQFRVYSENAAGMSDALIGPRSVRIQAGIGN